MGSTAAAGHQGLSTRKTNHSCSIYLWRTPRSEKTMKGFLSDTQVNLKRLGFYFHLNIYRQSSFCIVGWGHKQPRDIKLSKVTLTSGNCSRIFKIVKTLKPLSVMNVQENKNTVNIHLVHRNLRNENHCDLKGFVSL